MGNCIRWLCPILHKLLCMGTSSLCMLTTPSHARSIELSIAEVEARENLRQAHPLPMSVQMNRRGFSGSRK